MKKQLSLINFIFIVITSLFTGACSPLKETESAEENQKQAVNVKQSTVSYVDPSQRKKISPPISINVESLTELTAEFNKLHYHLADCRASQCKVPHIIFNKVDKAWPKASAKLPVKTKKELFFSLMTPLILIANKKIEAEREVVKSYALHSFEFKKIASKYRLLKNSQQKIDESMRKQLLERVDTLPPSLALAQAAEESGWATSRFAIEGNAFFGQWDFSGNGMKPRQQRAHLGNYGVASFATPLVSVEGYMLNINKNSSYRKLRSLRAKLRAENQTVSGYQLAGTLDKYSERGQAYIDSLRSMISYNKLEPLDQAHLSAKPRILIWVN